MTEKQLMLLKVYIGLFAISGLSIFGSWNISKAYYYNLIITGQAAVTCQNK